ncbi:hypothetical protein [Flavicella sediminum]|uniref:hypothetical protein n=1 Tax=Flavicella sediminum TaxID=2585141 RepID=UPI0011205EC9|nr:hypothetical protein [Flavicella sediminum]
MEYHKIFKTNKQNTLNEQTASAKIMFQQAYKNELAYIPVYNKILFHLNLEIKKLYIYTSNWVPTLNKLYEEQGNYNKNYEINVFKNEFKNYFESNDRLAIPDSHTPALILQEFGIYRGLEEAKRLLSRNSNLYELMYKTNEFGKFEFIKYENGIEILPEYNRLMEIVSPKNNSNLSTDSKKQDKPLININKTSEVKPLKIILEQQQQLYLLYLMNKNLKELNKTDLFKIICLCSINYNPSIFSGAISDSYEYKIFTQGYLSKNTNTRVQFVENIMNLVKPLNFKKLNQLLTDQYNKELSLTLNKK